jgi:peroxiredoxin
VLAAVAVVGLGIGLLTHVGVSAKGGPPHAGSKAPAFTLPGVNVTSTVGTPENGGAHGRPVVILFMGAWCSVCQGELPPLAATIRSQRKGDGDLKTIAVLGVDSADTLSAAQSLVRGTGVDFPVGDDRTAHVMNGLYEFRADPYAVFVKGNGTIMAIHPGPMSPAQFVALERKLVAK